MMLLLFVCLFLFFFLNILIAVINRVEEPAARYRGAVIDRVPTGPTFTLWYPHNHQQNRNETSVIQNKSDYTENQIPDENNMIEFS